MEGTRATVTYSGNSVSTPAPDFSKSNIKLNSTMNKRPPRAGYIKEDDFFEILINSYKGTYSHDGYWHPGDLYVNVLSVLEIVCNTLSAQVDLEVGRPVRNVKEV